MNPSIGLGSATERARQLAPGFMAAASFLCERYHAPVMLFALLSGMAMNFRSVDGKCKPGIEVTAREVLRLGETLFLAGLVLLTMVWGL